MAGNRGGARPGAGAKPRAVSEKEKKRILKAVNKAAKEIGRTPHEIFAEVLTLGKFMNRPVELKDWNTSYRIYLEAVLVKSSHKQIDVEVKDNRIAVYLPEVKNPSEEVPRA